MARAGQTDQPRGSALKLALVLTCVVLVVELTGGLISHSLALLSDAGHVLTDVFALGLAWFAVAQAKPPGRRSGAATATTGSASWPRWSTR